MVETVAESTLVTSFTSSPAKRPTVSGRSSARGAPQAWQKCPTSGTPQLAQAGAAVERSGEYAADAEGSVDAARGRDADIGWGVRVRQHVGRNA